MGPAGEVREMSARSREQLRGGKLEAGGEAGNRGVFKSQILGGAAGMRYHNPGSGGWEW